MLTKYGRGFEHACSNPEENEAFDEFNRATIGAVESL
jgi:hypothetical protein